MKTACIQMKTVADNDKNIAAACRYIAEAAAEKADVVILPEMFSCPYKASNFPVYAQEEGGKNWKSLSEAARQHHVYLVAGTMPERAGDKIYNTAYVFDRDGKQIARHRKAHLFDCNLPGVHFFESDSLSAGDAVTTFQTEFGTMGLMICFDIRFPLMASVMQMRGAKAIFVPAAFNMTSGPNWWELMFRARAADNQLFMIGAAPARDESSSYVAYGNSIVVSPWGKVIARLDEKEAILYADIDFKEEEDMRDCYHIISAERKELYELIDKTSTNRA